MIVLGSRDSLKIAKGSLDFKLRTSYKYVAIRSSLTAYTPFLGKPPVLGRSEPRAQ